MKIILRNSSLFLVSIFLSIQCSAQKDNLFTFSGKIEGIKSGKVYTQTIFSQSLDSADIKEGMFNLKLSVTSFDILVPAFKDESGKMFMSSLQLFAKPNIKVHFNGNKNNPEGWTIGGNMEIDQVMALKEKIFDKQSNLNNLLKKYADEKGNVNLPQTEILTAMGLLENINQTLHTFIDEHPRSPAATIALIQSLSMTPEGLKKENNKKLFARIDNAIVPELKESTIFFQLKGMLVNDEVAPDFTQNDVSGKPVSLSSFRGKYVLLDFWASWCGPCRMENPNVVDAYQKYKDKNFTVIGVSLDKDKSSWLNAIQKDNLTWTHVSDLQGWQNAVAQLYQVQGIPINYLIAPDGKIVEKNLRGERLHEVLKKILN